LPSTYFSQATEPSGQESTSFKTESIILNRTSASLKFPSFAIYNFIYSAHISFVLGHALFYFATHYLIDLMLATASPYSPDKPHHTILRKSSG